MEIALSLGSSLGSVANLLSDLDFSGLSFLTYKKGGFGLEVATSYAYRVRQLK